MDSETLSRAGEENRREVSDWLAHDDASAGVAADPHPIPRRCGNRRKDAGGHHGWSGYEARTAPSGHHGGQLMPHRVLGVDGVGVVGDFCLGHPAIKSWVICGLARLLERT